MSSFYQQKTLSRKAVKPMVLFLILCLESMTRSQSAIKALAVVAAFAFFPNAGFAQAGTDYAPIAISFGQTLHTNPVSIEDNTTWSITAHGVSQSGVGMSLFDFVFEQPGTYSVSTHTAHNPQSGKCDHGDHSQNPSYGNAESPNGLVMLDFYDHLQNIQSLSITNQIN